MILYISVGSFKVFKKNNPLICMFINRDMIHTSVQTIERKANSDYPDFISFLANTQVLEMVWIVKIM